MEQLEEMARKGAAAVTAAGLETTARLARTENGVASEVRYAAPADGTSDADRALPLAEKARRFQKDLQERHRPWRGLVVAAYLKPDGSIKDFKSYADSAIWTGNYIASQAWRWSVTKDTDALHEMEESLRGFVALHDATGIPGLIARWIAPLEYVEPRGLLKSDDWHKGTGAFAGWAWKGDLSHDQYHGYLFGLATAWPYIQDEKLKADVKRVAAAIGDHVIKNDLRIIGPGTFLDFRGNYFEQEAWPSILRGLPMPPLRSGNCMSGLHLMTVVHYITKEKRFRDFLVERMLKEEEFDLDLKKYGSFFADEFLKRHLTAAQALVSLHYDSDVRITPESMRSDVSQNLAHSALHDLATLEKDKDLKALYRGVFKRVHRISESDGNSYWDFLYARASGGDERAVKDGVETLRRFPARAYYGEVKNSLDPALAKYKAVHSTSYKGNGRDTLWFGEQPLPFERRALHTAFAWQSNPYQLDGGDADEEGSGADYLVAYWMGRASGYIKPGD